MSWSVAKAKPPVWSCSPRGSRARVWSRWTGSPGATVTRSARTARAGRSACLDAYRPGWELVDWPRYTLFGVGRSAGMQFSRGCPLTCTYCGQWMFWKQWRHRSPENFVAELRTLAEQYGVKIVWLADENFAASREVVVEVLQRLIAADLGLSLNINMTAADVVRDADYSPPLQGRWRGLRGDGRGDAQ